MSVSPTLESVAAAFKTWRNNPQLGRKQVPLSLRQQAIALLANYPISQVINTLGLSHSALKRWQQSTPEVDEAPEANQFIPLPESPETPSLLCVTVCIGDDTQLVVEGELTSHQLSAVVRELQAVRRR